jgi:glycosyltransferase involved in cell wall biosynthesis
MTAGDAAPAGRRPLRIAFFGPFGLHPKATMLARAAPAARALVARGHHVAIIMPPWHTPAEAGRTWDEAGVHYEYVELAGPRVPGASHLAVSRRMVRAAWRWRADIVHAFKPKAYSGLAAMHWQALRRGRVLVDTDDWEGAGGWNEVEPYPLALRVFFRWQENAGLRWASGVSVASRALETIVWSLGVPPGDVRYVPNAVDAVPAEARPDPAAPAVLLYTRFFEFGLERAVALFRGVRARVPATRLIVVGRGLRSEENRFLGLAHAAGCADAVDYLGWLGPAERQAAFARASVAMYPFDDTLVNRTKSPAKLLELLAEGIPVVADGVGELREVLGAGRGGLLAPPDESGFVGALCRVLEDADLRRTLSVGARERVSARYTWARQAPDLEALYAGGNNQPGCRTS